PAAAQPDASHTILSFDQLDGWQRDDHRQALEAFLETCGDLKDAEWSAVCGLAKTHPNPRVFFELFFRPVLIEDGLPGLFTGYFEPVLNGSRRPSYKYKYPLYRKPPELAGGTLWFPRAVIEGDKILAGRGLEIAWVDDPVELFFLQIQGSGRIRLPDGSTIRVGYGGANGHSYHSIGDELVRRGIYQPHQVSAEVIRNWVSRNPDKGAELLHTNPAYVFFREIRGLPAEKGPLGAMNRPLTAERTLAVDPKFVPLGAPVWLEKGGRTPMRRLMVAQDTGSAIKGAQRGDIFFGTGRQAGREAAKISDPGRMVVLLPIEKAYQLAGGFPK
ncbi:MAG TPA: murein transglycosylase, partial [Rhodobacteraceae bacterium]|nr:murein transglycosylase [Paracoccaceae bacterium]